ncbi:MAG: lipopolysaccharide kinase InaA family protein [Gemmatimonadaceae bacterium]
MRLPLPEGYVRLELEAHGGGSAGVTRAVVLQACADAVRGVLEGGSLYEWARAQPDRREYVGRGPAFGVSLPGCEPRLVVRRARHGGVLAPLLGDVFVAPTRAPRELVVTLFLRRLGIATPLVLAYATYRAGPLLRRADVATTEVPNATPLSICLAQGTEPPARVAAWQAAVALLRRLTAAGVWHPDLNAANILLQRSESGSLAAVLLDVDRVRFSVPGDPQLAGANVERLLRSIRKGASRGTLAVDASELTAFTADATRPLPPAAAASQAAEG